MKNITRFIPLQLSVFLVFGILTGNYYTLSINTLLKIVTGIFLLLLVLFFSSKKKFHLLPLFSVFAFLLMFFIGWLRISFQNPSLQKNHFSTQIKTSNTLIFQIEETLKPTGYYERYFAKIIQIDSVNCEGKIAVNLAKNGNSNKLELGKVYLSRTSIRELQNPLNPYAFNYKKYLNSKGITQQLFLQSGEYKELAKNVGFNLYISARKWSQKIQKKLNPYPFGKDELGIIKALVLGQRKDISKELLQQYAGAGAVHILAVSGLHVGILFLLFSFILKPLQYFRYGNTLKTLLIILLLFGFALLTGLSGSVVRAVSMFSFIAIGNGLKNRENPILYALLTSFFLLLLIRPSYLFDIGFQMSYSAVLGIILFQPLIIGLFPKSSLWIFKKLLELLSVSIAATIGTFPISLYYFHQFPGLFFITNVVIIPFLGSIMILGILVVLLAYIGMLPDALIILYNTLLHYMNGFIEWIASFDTFLIKNISFSPALLVSSYLVIAAVYYTWHSKKATRLPVLLLSMIVLQAVVLFEKYQTQHSNQWVIFHKTKESIMGIKKGQKLRIISSKDSVLQWRPLQSYMLKKQIHKTSISNSIPNVFRYENTTILVVDSMGIYQKTGFKPQIIYLRESPKINLERLCQLYRPEYIIADGSNYKNMVNTWEKTCKKTGQKFYYTGQKGAFIR